MDGKQTKTNGLSRNTKAIILFVVLSFVFPYLLGNLIFSFHNDFLSYNWGYIVMYCPGIACLITYIAYRDQVSQLGFCLCKAKYIFLGIALPVFYLVLSYSIHWILFSDTLLSKFHLRRWAHNPIHIVFSCFCVPIYTSKRLSRFYISN